MLRCWLEGCGVAARLALPEGWRRRRALGVVLVMGNAGQVACHPTGWIPVGLRSSIQGIQV
jgi:hypothetical protein